MKKKSFSWFVFLVMTTVFFGFSAVAFAVPTAVTGAADPVTWDFAVLRGVSNPNGLVTTAYFEYGIDTNYGTLSSAVDIGSGVQEVASVFTTSELLPATTYHYRIAASNSEGTIYGSDESFLTPDSPVNSPSIWFQPVDLESAGIAAAQLDSTQPFDARAADDFLYANPDHAIGQVRWWVSEWNGAPPYVEPSAFNIYIYSNNEVECSPDTVIQSWTIPFSECHEEEFDHDSETYSFWVDLIPEFIPQPNVHYWVSIQAVLDYSPQVGLKLAAGTSDLCVAMQIFELAGLPNWTTVTSNKDIAYIFYPGTSVPLSSHIFPWPMFMPALTQGWVRDR